ncbi:glycosyltransferase family 2 protein [Flavobacterium algicola]|uniref:glycosyltransferase family 2 protein n=1 Tax=Flavobacterium algicola TaxID=556529 RepID=UPI001EFE79FE|nr:glycosyltransferase family 2 protein [Flavobacterium algicola]MCG9793329.1 glycosyltransferase family 2 protein [Flavobacterium algicola]
MQLSVVILNYNVQHFLELCLLSVQSAIEGLDAELIVVDNNSPDDSCDMVKRKFPNVILVENKDNAGFPKGNNIGVAIAKGAYVCILNPDTVVAEDTFIKVLAFAERQKDLGIVGVKLIDGVGNFLPESKRGVPTPWVAFTKIAALYKLFPRVSSFGQYYASHINENQTGKVAILVGAFMIMKRQLYLDIGGFDEDCFMYSDDIDLSYMALKKGKTNFYFHETTVIHYKGESTVKDGTYMKRFQEAMNFFYKKHFRVSILFSLFMKIGILSFSIIKRFQGKDRKHKDKDHFILFSKNRSLVESIESVVQKKIDFRDLEANSLLLSGVNHSISGTEIILDNHFISFKECIAFMELLKSYKFTFKILPKNTNFLIGSDNSNERGTVLKIEYKMHNMK